MYFPQSDVLRGLDKNFVKEFMDIAEKETHKPGYTLFRQDEPVTSTRYGKDASR